MTDQTLRSVALTRVFQAPIELVFDAWTKPEYMVKWQRCDTSMEVSFEGWQPVAGTKFSTTMSKPGEWSNASTGRVLEVDPPRLLVYAGDPDDFLGMAETIVRVELEEVEGGTQVILTHTGMPNDLMCSVIEAGWTGGMKLLEELLPSMG